MDSPVIDIDAVLASQPPLSNLPTPPPPRERQIPKPEMPTGPTTMLDDAIGHIHTVAEHLISLLPSNLRIDSESGRRSVRLFLEHAWLLNSRPWLLESHVGLAACILKKIRTSFTRSWRQSLFHAKVRPERAETIVLAGLCIATSFLQDSHNTAEFWYWTGRRRWIHADTKLWPSTREFSTTVRCVLEEIDWRIHAFTPGMIAEATHELTRGRRPTPESASPSPQKTPLPVSIAALQISVELGQEDQVDVALRGGACADGDLLDPPYFCRPLRASSPSMCEDKQDDSKRDSGYGGVAIWARGAMTPEPTPPLDSGDEKEGGPFLRLL